MGLSPLHLQRASRACAPPPLERDADSVTRIDLRWRDTTRGGGKTWRIRPGSV